MAQNEVLPTYIRPKRILGKENPLIALSKEQLKDSLLSTDENNALWCIGRVGNGFDYFVGKPINPLNSEVMKDLTVKPSYSRRCRETVETPLGETVEADVVGVINPEAITDDQKNVVSCYINPHKEKSANVHPEIFTFSSAFYTISKCKDVDLNRWHMINRIEDIEALLPAEKENLLAELLLAGLGVLEHESTSPYIKLAAKRLRMLGESPKLGFHITPDVQTMLIEEKKVSERNLKNLAPESHSLVYFPNFDSNNPQMGEIIVPTEWIWTAFSKPIPALCSILYASSLVRDDYFGKLRGSQSYFVKGFASAEFSDQPIAVKRAESLVVDLHAEVDNYDLREYFINNKADGFMRNLERKYPYGGLSNLYYLDPPIRQLERVKHG